MICGNIITKDMMSDYLKWAATGKSDALALGTLFSAVMPKGETFTPIATFGKQQRMLFLMYNEFISIERASEIAIATIGDANSIFSIPYRYARKKHVRDYIKDLSYSVYGTEEIADKQFKAIDSLLSDAEIAFLKSHSFSSHAKMDGSDNGILYSKFFCRLNGSHAPVELKSSADPAAMLLAPASGDDTRDPIAKASAILNGNDNNSALLESALKKIGSGTID